MLCVALLGAPLHAMEASAKDSVDVAEMEGGVSGVRTSIEHNFTWMAFVLTHQAMRHTENMKSWPFFAIASPVSWTSSLRAEKDLGKLLTLKGFGAGNVSIMDVGVTGDVSLEVIHLLELGASGNVHSGLNYSRNMSFMGVYDPEERDFDDDIFMTEFAYGVKYRVGLSIPLLALLPKSDWTKIILKPIANWTYTGYTGARDGEIWRCGQGASVNGWRYRYGGMLIYMLPFERFPMFMVNGGVGGFMKSAKFDEVYEDYDPYFKTVSFMPMLSVKISENWSGMLMTIISRDRSYNKYHYDGDEEYLLKRVGSEWRMNMIMMTFTRKW